MFVSSDGNLPRAKLGARDVCRVLPRAKLGAPIVCQVWPRAGPRQPPLINLEFAYQTIVATLKYHYII